MSVPRSSGPGEESTPLWGAATSASVENQHSTSKTWRPARSPFPDLSLFPAEGVTDVTAAADLVGLISVSQQ